MTDPPTSSREDTSKRFSTKDIATLIERQKEEKYLEFKGPMEWADKSDKILVVKAAIALANVPDGGLVVIGMKESDHKWIPVGLTVGQADSFVEDEVREFVAEYADPHVALAISRVEVNGKTFVAIEVAEFDHLPIICKKEFSGKLRRGALYTRSFRKPESREVSNEREMREIIERATERDLRRLLGRLKRVGISTISGQPIETSDKEKYDREEGNLRGG